MQLEEIPAFEIRQTLMTYSKDDRTMGFETDMPGVMASRSL